MFRRIAPSTAGYIFDLDLKRQQRYLEKILTNFTRETCAIIAAFASHAILEFEVDLFEVEALTRGMSFNTEFIRRSSTTIFPTSKVLIREQTESSEDDEMPGLDAMSI